MFLIRIEKNLLYEKIEIRSAIAASCFGTLTEEELDNHPGAVFSRLPIAFERI